MSFDFPKKRGSYYFHPLQEKEMMRCYFCDLKNLSDKRTNLHAFIYIPLCCIFESFLWEYFTASVNFITSVNKPMIDQPLLVLERSLLIISSDVTPEGGILYTPHT
jgi:hypothetical protein